MKISFWNTVAVFAVGLTMALAPVAPAAPQGHSGPVPPQGPLKPPVGVPACTHSGVEGVSMSVVSSGAAQCIQFEFELYIGVDQLGAQVKVKWEGCPAFLEIVPAHGKKVQKMHFNAVDKQPLSSTRQEYKAHCGGWFTDPSCIPQGAPTTSQGRSVNHWQEEGCDFLQ